MAAILSASGSQNTVPLDAAPSLEETDQLVRSAKKIKSKVGVEGEDIEISDYDEAWPPLPGMGEVRSTQKPSFVDKLKGVVHEPEVADTRGKESSHLTKPTDPQYLGNEEEELEEDFSIIEDSNRNFPEFVFSRKIKKRLYEAWEQSVIVKLLGRSIGFRALENRLQSMWAKQGILTLIDIGNGYFIAKLTSKGDYVNALTGGPWMIYDHYLTVRPWEPKFNPYRATIDKVAVWVRFPLIPTEYYDEEALRKMGNRLGQTLRVDMNTCCQLRGLFARVCVVMDLGKAFVSGFKLEGENYYLEYEGLHMLCTRCGIYGHQSDKCTKASSVNNAEKVSGNGNEGGVGVDLGKTTNHMEPQEVWKVVQKNWRPRKAKEKADNQDGGKTSGSRFDALMQLEEDSTDVTKKTNEEDHAQRPVVEGAFMKSAVRKGSVRSEMESRNKGVVRDGKNKSISLSTKGVVREMSNAIVLRGPSVRKRVEKRVRSEGTSKDIMVEGNMEASGPLLITMGPTHEAMISLGEAGLGKEKENLDPGDTISGDRVQVDGLMEHMNMDPLDSFVPETVPSLAH